MGVLLIGGKRSGQYITELNVNPDVRVIQIPFLDIPPLSSFTKQDAEQDVKLDRDCETYRVRRIVDRRGTYYGSYWVYENLSDEEAFYCLMEIKKRGVQHTRNL